MSYARTYPALGATVAAKDCSGGSVFNATDSDCYCPAGMESPDTFSQPCRPIDVNAPCAAQGKIRNPIDKQCACPPGMMVNPDPRFSNCIPGYWFPDCVDAAGNRVPNCVRGVSMTRTIPLVAAGVAAGFVIAALLFKKG